MAINEPTNQRVQRPLYVDLDGTLIEGDTLWESAAALAGRNILSFAAASLRLSGGRAAFKAAIAERIELYADDLKYNDAVLAFIEAEAESRPVVLATAAHEKIAASVTEKFPFFSDRLSTTASDNMKGARKLDAVRAHAAQHGWGAAFDYVGDSRADAPLFDAADNAYVVAPTAARARELAGGKSPATHFTSVKASARDYIKAMRVHQWVKNVLIFLPLILAHKIFDAPAAIAAIVTFIAFSLCASATYILNDLVDIRADRRHPTKRERPFASGRLKIPEGLAFAGFLFAVSFALAASIDIVIVGGLLIGYIIATLSYSLVFKEKLLVDVIMLALLYGYRIIVGGVATGIPVSDWLIAFSIFFFLGLAFVKRYSEISTKTPGPDGKISGRGYYTEDREIVGVLGVSTSLISLLVFSFYTTSPEVVALYSRPQLLWLVCIGMLYWVSRVWVLAHRGHMPDDPIVFAIKDRNSLIVGALAAVIVAAAI
ncbi:MAG: UbiA family prenyltransferase [Parvularculaceae bacterium]